MNCRRMILKRNPISVIFLYKREFTDKFYEVEYQEYE